MERQSHGFLRRSSSATILPSSEYGAETTEEQVLQRVLRQPEPWSFFGLDKDQVFHSAFGCFMNRKVLVQGRLYLFDSHACFRGHYLNGIITVALNFRDMPAVRKAKLAGVVGGIECHMKNAKKYTFVCFQHKERALALLLELWHKSKDSGVLHKGQYNVDHAACSESFVDLLPGETDVTLEGIRRSRCRSLSLTDMVTSPGCMDSSSCCMSTEQHDAVAVSNHEGEAYCNDGSVPNGVASKLKFIGEKKIQASVEQVFNLLFSDEAIPFLERFHTSQGDKSFHCSKWSAQEGSTVWTRCISFEHPIDYFFGPKSTNCEVVQRLQRESDGSFSVVALQSMPKLPFGDYFSLKILWEVQPCDHGAPTLVKQSQAVSFVKKTVLKAAIEQGANQASVQSFSLWSEKAVLEVEVQEVIKLSVASHIVEGRTFSDCARAMMDKEGLSPRLRQELRGIVEVKLEECMTVKELAGSGSLVSSITGYAHTFLHLHGFRISLVSAVVAFCVALLMKWC